MMLAETSHYYHYVVCVCVCYVYPKTGSYYH